MIRHAVNMWLTENSETIRHIADSIQKRINTYRYATWQLYENLDSNRPITSFNNLHEKQLHKDIYYLEKARRKTEALILGSHDSGTLDMAMRMSDYLDILWGAESGSWLAYCLNGQDNSLAVISTLPLKDLMTRYQKGAINNVVNTRRTEMLQQNNVLDERESFSPLRHFAWKNTHYFTLRTTFNQPGHLATVVAFDLPINELIPRNISAENLQLVQANSDTIPPDNENNKDLQIVVLGSSIEILSPLQTTPLNLIYRVPITTLLVETLYAFNGALLTNLILLLLSLAGLFLLRHQALQPRGNSNIELNTLQNLNEEIAAILPLGLLVYDFASDRSIISNKLAEHLLPHLNLQKIINMSDQHQRVLQITIDNETYEIRQTRSITSPHIQLFIMRDQERELLISKKLQETQQVLDKYHQLRRKLLQNLVDVLEHPLDDLVSLLQHVNLNDEKEIKPEIQQKAQSLQRIVSDILLLNRLETNDWSPDTGFFNLQSMLDEVVLKIVPLARHKGLTLLVHNHLSSDEIRSGDVHTIRKILSTLLHYSLITTKVGKITLNIFSSEKNPEKMTFLLIDTGTGLTPDEQDNANYLFFSKTPKDHFNKVPSLALFLCKQLCKKLGGQLEVYTKSDMGTRYEVTITAPLADQQPQEEKLLDGLTVLIEIAVNDVRKIACQQLENWGANCVMPDEYFSDQDYDLLVTDDPACMTPWSLLLTADEIGFRAISDTQYRVNFNITSAIQNALLQLIERKMAQGITVIEKDKSSLLSNGYYQLFVETVPNDVMKLYTESVNMDYSSLAQTVHRLKGVFAMLNLYPGRQLCEALEQHINEHNELVIKDIIKNIDNYVNALLHQGDQSDE